MKVKILKDCFVSSVGDMKAGEEGQVEDRLAKKLVARGFAEEATDDKPVAEKKKRATSAAVKKKEETGSED